MTYLDFSPTLTGSLSLTCGSFEENIQTEAIPKSLKIRLLVCLRITVYRVIFSPYYFCLLPLQTISSHLQFAQTWFRLCSKTRNRKITPLKMGAIGAKIKSGQIFPCEQPNTRFDIYTISIDKSRLPYESTHSLKLYYII